MFGRNVGRAPVPAVPDCLSWTPTTFVTAADGTRLAVEILGDAHDGPTLVFTHGWTFSSRCWHYQRALSARYRLVLYDHRDHGRSGFGPRDHRTIDQLGHDLHSVLRETTTGDRPTILVGHSMGGMTIMALAAHHAELFGREVVGVALVNTSAGRQPERTYGLPQPVAHLWLQRLNAALEQMRTDPQAAERLRRPGTGPARLLSRWLNFGRRPDPRLVRFTEAMTAATATQVIGDFYATLDQHDKVAALDAVGHIPALVVVGDRDRLTPPSHARALAAALGRARLLELAGAGHVTMLEEPDAVNAALEDLIQLAVRPAPVDRQEADVIR